jgi:hypothetical protein
LLLVEVLQRDGHEVIEAADGALFKHGLPMHLPT